MISALLGVVSLLLVQVLIYFLFLKKRLAGAPTTALDQATMDNAADALLQRAKVEAKSDAERQKIDDIMKNPDSNQRIKQLSDALKGL